MFSKSTHRTWAITAVTLAASASLASADTLIRSSSDNGFFTPFNSGNVGSTTYGDSWWIGNTGTAYSLTRVTIGLASFGGSVGGTTDITVGIHDGDPSGLIFGPGTTLYSTTITGVVVPAAVGSGTYFNLVVDLPNVQTTGGFNNVGLSISLSNYSYGGDLGFQLSTANGQTNGFYTNNASYNPGTGWSLFSFGANPNTGIGNYTVSFEGTAVPAPTSAAALALAGCFAGRRRR